MKTNDLFVVYNTSTTEIMSVHSCMLFCSRGKDYWVRNKPSSNYECLTLEEAVTRIRYAEANFEKYSLMG